MGPRAGRHGVRIEAAEGLSVAATSALLATIAGRQAEVMRCLREAHELPPAAVGVSMRWRIETDGTVSDVAVLATTWDDAGFLDCAQHTIGAWNLGPQASPVSVVGYPFELTGAAP